MVIKVPRYITNSTREPWDCISEKFEFIEEWLNLWRIQTHEDAINLDGNKLQWYDRSRDKFIDPWLQIPYVKQVDNDAVIENFNEAKQLLEYVKPLIEERRISIEFLNLWGDLCERYGYLSSAFFSLESELGYERAKIKGKEAKNRDSQRQWLAHILLDHLENGKKPKDAERKAAQLIKDIIEHKAFTELFDADWFKVMVNANGTLKATYCQNHFSKKTMKELVKKPVDKLPPVKFNFPKT